MFQKIRYRILISVVLFLSIGVQAQTITTFDLPKSLGEASGLEALNDSVLVLINDGGNKAELIIIDTKGKLIKKVKVLDAHNEDWEDLARDDQYLYIGDFGNNLNKRTNLCVYKVRIKSILEKDEVSAEKIKFSYQEQVDFPPAKKDYRFDCEAMVNYANSLLIFTKTNTVPWDGKSWMYSIPKEPGTYVLKKENEIFIGNDGWLIDAVTAADYFENKLYLLTYNRRITFNFANKEPVLLKTDKFQEATQKEALLILTKKKSFLADETHPFLGGGKLYRWDE